jgi:hypothetical protein
MNIVPKKLNEINAMFRRAEYSLWRAEGAKSFIEA